MTVISTIITMQCAQLSVVVMTPTPADECELQKIFKTVPKLDNISQNRANPIPYPIRWKYASTTCP